MKPRTFLSIGVALALAGAVAAVAAPAASAASAPTAAGAKAGGNRWTSPS